MGGFVSSVSSVTRHDVFAIERTPPAVIRALSTGKVILIGQFPWGPDGVVFQPTDPADRAKKLAPAGMDRTASGYLATIRKAWSDLRIVRVIGSAAAKAAVTIQKVGAVDCLTVTAKYKGVAGNSINAIVEAASDGDVNHFNLRVNVTGASGSTEDLFTNLNVSGTGADVLPSNFDSAALVGAIAKVAAGRPVNGTYPLVSGSDGTIDATAYAGTAGTGDKGIALAETVKGPLLLLLDDPGDSLRAGANAAVHTQASTKKDRIAVLSGDSGQSLANVQSDVASYRAATTVYVDVWAYIYDDTDGTKRLVPPNSFAASVMSQLSPSTSPAWKDPEVQAMLTGIVDLETPRGDGAGSNTEAGIMTLQREENGGYTFEAGVTTIAPSDPRRKNITRTRMGQYMAAAVTSSLRPYVDAPSVPLNQQDVVAAVDRMGKNLKANRDRDPNHTPHLLDWQIQDLSAFNSAEDLAAGKFFIPAKAKTSPAMEQIFFSVEFGETVQVTAT